MPHSPHEEARVREANRRFYQAVENLSLEDMEAVWLPGAACRCVHPGWPLLEGWEAIRESWSRIFENTSALEVAIDQITVHIEGTVAWLNCIERVSSAAESRIDAALVCTSNLFVLHEGEWRMMLHHASHLPDLMEGAQTDMIQ